MEFVSSSIDRTERPRFKNNPEAVLPEVVPISPDDPEHLSRLLGVTVGIVEGWTADDISTMIVSVLQGGITNALFVVHNLNKAEKVVVRIFGMGTEMFIDRKIENQVFAYLSALNMAPTFHGLFENGRVEGFLNARNLAPAELSRDKTIRNVSVALAELHRQVVPLSDPNPIWRKTNHILQLISGSYYFVVHEINIYILNY
jgi:hypothetical protein